jgi:hypothetical protein
MTPELSIHEALMKVRQRAAAGNAQNAVDASQRMNQSRSTLLNAMG